MQQPISRRRILTLAGSGLAGVAAAGTAGQPARADTNEPAQTAVERAYRALALPHSGMARIQHTGSPLNGATSIDAVLDGRSVDQDREMVVHVRVTVPDDLVGLRRVLRTVLIGDNGDLRMETVGPDTRLDDAAFELDIALGRGDPIRDWNLIPERIFALRVSIDILRSDEFAVSDDYLFKVRAR
jgi:hypothetical protein